MKELERMGYREIQKGRWIKPIGFNALYYNCDNSVIMLATNDLQGNPISWVSATIEPSDNFLNDLKVFESDAGYGKGYAHKQGFVDYSFEVDNLHFWEDIL